MIMENAISNYHLSAATKSNILYKALLIRQLEELLLNLYSKGELHGTVHTCIGQEFSGAVISECLRPGDSIFSNHRCHGHFLATRADVSGLLCEIYGKKDGVSGGRGGSQHLCSNGFYSNGIQGGITPVAAGLAFAKKLKEQQCLSIVFIGDGTLGEGALYETFNLCSQWKLPIVFILENNLYAQSTHQSEVLSGDICARAQAFDIYTDRADTWNWEQLHHTAAKLIDYTRTFSVPTFLQIDTYRLRAHSKGDDHRSNEEIRHYISIDPLHLFQKQYPEQYLNLEQKVEQEIEKALLQARLSAYSDTYLSTLTPLTYESIDIHHRGFMRLGHAINQSLKELMADNQKIYFIGEDVKSPYGGAFKISNELSDLFPSRVFNTPISESAIVGTGIGLAMEGFKPIVEIMFGDFITLAMDQIINHASKFRYMYNEQVRVPLMIRVPMGGGRGYGPTHSQTLDRHLFGIPGLRVVAIHHLMHPKLVYQSLLNTSEDPSIVIENKALYTLPLRTEPPLGFTYKMIHDSLPIILVEPESDQCDLTIIAYGGLSELAIEIMEVLFLEHDLIAQFICPTQIYPFNIKACYQYTRSQQIVIIEEGQGYAGFGSEIMAQIVELCELNSTPLPKMRRLYAAESAIPACKALEENVLPEKTRVIEAILKFLNIF